MLRGKGWGNDNQHHSTSTAMNRMHTNKTLINNRKRSLSGSAASEFETPNKIAKVVLSPLGGERKDYNKGGNVGPSLSLPLLQSNTPNVSNVSSSPSSSSANLAMLAVITFYSAFQYLDQWPPIFVKM